MLTATGSEDLCKQLHIDNIDDMTPHAIANFINNAFLEPMKVYQPLESLPPFEPTDSVLQLNEREVYQALALLKPGKASGPDGVPNWFLKEYAEILALPVCALLNSSFADQQLPSS